MKKSIMIYSLAISVCLVFVGHATIETGWQEWGCKLEPSESFTCIAYYIPDVPGVSKSLIFEKEPAWTTGHGYDYGDRTDWLTALSQDSKIAYLYGPRATNETDDLIGWFSYNLFYKWDNAASDFDANYPVYQDTVMWDGFQQWDDLTSNAKWGKRGTPGNGSEVVWEDSPGGGLYEEPHTYPVPGPATICLLGLGAAFLRIKKPRRM